MSTNDDHSDQGEARTPEETAAESAPLGEQAEEERARSRPFSYPAPERRPGVRAVRHISREEADADMPPGTSGSYGTTGGGQPGGTGVGVAPDGTLDDSAYADTVAAAGQTPEEDESTPPDDRP